VGLHVNPLYLLKRGFAGKGIMKECGLSPWAPPKGGAQRPATMLWRSSAWQLSKKPEPLCDSFPGEGEEGVYGTG